MTTIRTTAHDVVEDHQDVGEECKDLDGRRVAERLAALPLDAQLRVAEQLEEQHANSPECLDFAQVIRAHVAREQAQARTESARAVSTPASSRSVTCAVCGARVRVSKGLLAKHRDAGHHLCDNSGCSVDANDGARPVEGQR